MSGMNFATVWVQDMNQLSASCSYLPQWRISIVRSQCFILIIGSDLFISFRGTELPQLRSDWSDFLSIREFLADWLTNVQYKLVKFRADIPGRVHLGFLQAVDVLWRLINPVLAEFTAANPDGRVFVTGHSQGAALAILTVAKLLYIRRVEVQRVADDHSAPPAPPFQIRMCVFAPPLVGDASFVEGMNARAAAVGAQLIRFTNPKDPIPLLPPDNRYAPGPGIHVHLEEDQRTQTAAGQANEWYNAHLPLEVDFFFSALPRLKYHFLAGPGIGDVRPGYLPLLLAYPPQC